MLKGFLKNKQEWTIEEKEWLKCVFDTLTYAEMGKHLNRSDSAIRHMANKMGLRKNNAPLNPHREYNYNFNFFHEIKTEEQAYWAGFIAADGNIFVGNNGNYVSIELAIRDKDHLKKFNKDIQGNVKVIERDRNAHTLSSGRIIKESKTCQIRLYCNQLVNDLIALNIVPNKTYIHKDIPVFNNPLLDIAFLRGYFDGNGSLFISKNKSLIMDITSPNKKYLDYWRIYLFKNYNITSYIVAKKADNQIENKIDCYKLVFRGLTNSYNIGNLLYGDAKIFLSRKYNLFYRYLYENNVKDRINNIPKGNYITSSIASLISND